MSKEIKITGNTMVIDPEFKFGDIVYSLVDIEQEPIIITQYCLLPQNALKYGGQSSFGFAWYNGFELSSEKNVVLAVT